MSAAAVRQPGGARRPWRGTWAWFAALGLAVLLPWIVFDWGHGRHDGFAVALLTQTAIMSVFALSYNMLLGQSGLLSFGHAVFLGLPAYVTIHVMNAIAAGHLWIPEELLPLAGGVSGLLFAALLGYPATRQRATAFAMITFGIGELVTAAATMFRSFFGGEGGVTADRVLKTSLLGLSYGSAIEVYYLALAWTVIAVVLMRLLARTPLGLMAEACRDNYERVQFLGYDPHGIRFRQFALSGFFAGIAGALYALTYEIVTYDAVGPTLSGNALFMTFIGGVGVFWGPIVGAVLVVIMQSWVGLVSNAWQIYVGVLFIAMVMYAPGGLAGLILLHGPLWRQGRFQVLLLPYARVALPSLLAVLGFVALVELGSSVTLGEHERGAVRLFGRALDPASPWLWGGGAALLLIGGSIAWRQGRVLAARWALIAEGTRAG